MRVAERTKETSEINEKLLQEIKDRKEAEENYRLLFEHVSDVVFTMDTELILTSVTPSVEKALGYKPQELVGRHVSELSVLEPSYYEKAVMDILRVLSGERTYATYQFVAKDGQIKVEHVSESPIYRDGKPIGCGWPQGLNPFWHLNS